MPRDTMNPDEPVNAGDPATAGEDDGFEAGRERAWRMLDLLPKGEPHPSLAATTIEMSTVTTGGLGGGGRGSEAARWPRRAIAAVLLAASLAAGFVAGSRARGVPDEPLAVAAGRHLAVLKEAGSVEFLRALANRDVPPPRRPGGPRAASEGGGPTEPYEELDAAIEDFRAALGTAGESRPPRDPRRIDDTLRSVERLSAGEWYSLAATARALADPQQIALVEAARRWHQWVVASDPVERRILPTLGTKDRLEWLVRRSRPWKPPGIRGPFPPPGDVRPPRETRGPAG